MTCNIFSNYPHISRLPDMFNLSIFQRMLLFILLPSCSCTLCFSQSETLEFDSSKVNSEPKLILLIADGMGTSQLGLLDMAWEYGRKHGHLPDRENSYRKALASGTTTLLSVKPSSFLVTDSACAASSISTGKPCLPETMGFDDTLNPLESFSEFAKRKSVSVGLISDTRLTHATPAAFYGRVLSRNDENKLVQQFISSGTVLALSAGTDYFSDKQNTLLARKGYSIVHTGDELENADRLPLLGLFSATSMPDALTEQHSDTKPSLLAMTKKALSLFGDTEKFFLLIEAGQIDWASHQNDAGLLLREMLRFESVLHYLLNYLAENKNTSLVLLSDHETGGFTFTYRKVANRFPGRIFNLFRKYAPGYDFIDEKILDSLFRQKKSLKNIGQEIDNGEKSSARIGQILLDGLGILPPEDLVSTLESAPASNIKYSSCSEAPLHYPYQESETTCILRNYLDSERGIVWSTGTHTSNLIPLILIGSIQNAQEDLPRSLPEVGGMLRSFFEFANIKSNR
jgi:alkaline phosphatase